MKTEIYLIGGMNCAACSSSIERRTQKLNGVQESSVNLTTEKMTITYDETVLSAEEIIKAVSDLDFTIRPYSEDEIFAKKEETKESSVKGFGIFVSCILAAHLLYISMGQMLFENLKVPSFISMTENPTGFAHAQMVLALIIMLIGWRKFVSGFKSLFHLAPNMDTLVAVSCVCAFVYSLVMTFNIKNNPAAVHNLYYESCGVVLTFVSLGKYLEERSKKKTTSAIKGLMDLAPLKALKFEKGQTTEIDAADLKVGDVVLVVEGARIPADGVVIDGEAEIDESAFTGESLPVHKELIDSVIGGSLNLSGSLYVEVRKVGKDTTLAGIIKFVEDAQGKKAPIASLADKVAGVFVPVVMGIAVLAAVIWLIAGQSFAFALKVFTCVLVIACPCALGLATPTAIICGTGLGAQHGILIRSGEALETTGKLDVVVLDKTGTVTEGKPKVSNVFPVGITDDELIGYCSAIEQYSDHPLAKAVTSYKRAPKDIEISEFKYISGRGMSAVLKDGRKLIAGNLPMMEENSVDCTLAADEIKKRSEEGKSNIILALSGKLIGFVSLSDTVRDSSAALIEELKALNVKTVLLTGDNKAAANYIGSLIGVDEVIAEVLPSDKAAVIEKIKAGGKYVMMVGDGVNDAPALVSADVGCAIGSGSDIAIDAADIVLMHNDPLDVARSIKLSKMTIRNIKQNLFWAFFYNCIGIPIAAGILFPINGILLSPMVGGLAMSCSSVFVVSNALRLRTKKL